MPNDATRATADALPVTRPDLEALIEAAIARLDEIDGDPDIEDGADDEPDLGRPEGMRQSAGYAGRDGEWSLGSWSICVDQEFWGMGSVGDVEDEHDGAEPDCDAEPDEDGEPSLGSNEDLNQNRWSMGGFAGVHDIEEACEDEGFQGGRKTHWLAGWDAQAATTAACVEAVDSLRKVQTRHGEAPVPPLLVLGGAIVRG